MMRRFLTFVLLIALSFPAYAGDPDTINTVPQSNSAFLSDLQTFLREEDGDRFGEMFNGFVVSGGTHATGAGLTKAPSSLTAYPGGHRIAETGSIVYPDNDTCWVIAHRTVTGNVGTYTRVAGTHYLIDCASVSLPTLPSNAVQLMEVVTAAGAVTTVTDLRITTPQKLFDHVVDVSTYDTLADAVTAQGSNVKTLLIATSETVSVNLNIPSNLTLWFLGQGQLSVSGGATVTLNNQVIADKNRQIFAGAATIPVTWAANTTVGKIFAEWWGVKCDNATDDTSAFNKALVQWISTKAILEIQEGTCLHDGILLTSPSGLIMQGAGRGSTVIKKRVVNSPAKPVIDITGASNLTVRDLTIDGNKTASEEGGVFNNNTNSGIRCVNCSSVVLERLRIQKTPGFAFSFRPTDNNQANVYVEDVQTDDTARVDFGGNGTANVVINKLRSTNFHDTSSEGWVIDQGAKAGFVLTNSELHGTATMPAIGITIRGGPNPRIINNYINLIREANLIGIEIGEDAQDGIIRGNVINVVPVNAADNTGINFAVATAVFNGWEITENSIKSRGGTGSWHIGTDDVVENAIIARNILKSSSASFAGHFISFNTSLSKGIKIDGNLLDGSNITGAFTFIEVDSDDSSAVNNILRGGSGAETGIKINLDADNWFVCGNVFKNVTTQTDFTTATNIAQCNTTAPVVDTYVVKAADETVNNSATLQDDDHLAFSCLANKSYKAELVLLLNAANTTADWKMGWTVPAAATMFWGSDAGLDAPTFGYWSAPTTGSTATLVLLTESGTLSFGSIVGTHGVRITVIARCAGTAGSFQFRWAQNTANASDSKILKDSHLIFRELQ